MSAVALSRESLRARIDIEEALVNVLNAIADLSEIEWEPHEKPILCLAISEDGGQRRPITSVHAIPQSVALAGLQAMKAALESMLENA